MGIDNIKQHLAAQFQLSEDQIEEMLPVFVTNIRSQMKDLERAVRLDDLTETGRIGHRIRGAFLNLGLEECARLAAVLEERGKIQDIGTNFKKLLHQLAQRVDLELL
jgi:HPt (histidine-containing phosphotransfer) domain-containing protein